VSNFIGADFSAALTSSVDAVSTGAAFARAALPAAGFAAVDLGPGLLGFTVTFDVAIMGACLGCGRAAFFLMAALLRAAFPALAFPGFLAALLGFFEGIYGLRLFTKERAIIPARTGLYRLSA